MTNRKLATATLLGIVTVGLVGCGAGSSSHVVARVAPTSSSVSVAPASVPGTAPVSGDVGATSTTTASGSLNPQTLDQVGADLGRLDNNSTRRTPT